MSNLMINLKDTVWHKWLRRPYRLACVTDSGEGLPVVLLHGLGREAGVWQHLIEQLQGQPYRLLAFDLLGFGISPKPDWLQYSVDDHAAAIVASLRQRKVKGPVLLVGHSMGSLIAARIARLYPDLVRHLVLYEMPLYAGLPETRRYRMRLNFYFRLYKRVIQYQPSFDGMASAEKRRVRHTIDQAGKKIAEKVLDMTMTADVWRSFVRSLENVIMEQKTHEDIKQISAPIDVIYGSRDRLVIRGETKLLFGEDVTNITAHTIRESHRISAKASRFIAGRIEVAATGGTLAEIKAGHPVRKLTRKKHA